MLKFLVLFMLFALVSSSAYDFKDGSFNELIFENYKELSEQFDEPQSLRFHRDIEEQEPKNDSHEWKKELRNIECCNNKINPKTHDVLLDLKLEKECFKEIKGDDDDVHQFLELKSQVVCIVECVARKLEILDDNGDIIRDNFVKVMKTKYRNSGPQWKLDPCEEIIDKCLAEIKSDGLSIEDVSSSSVAPKCNSHTLKLEHCMWREYVRACPKDLQVDSPKCIKIRENLENSDSWIRKSVYFRYML